MQVAHGAVAVLIREHNDNPDLMVVYAVNICMETTLDSLVVSKEKVAQTVVDMHTKHATVIQLPNWLDF